MDGDGFACKGLARCHLSENGYGYKHIARSILAEDGGSHGARLASATKNMNILQLCLPRYINVDEDCCDSNDNSDSDGEEFC